MNIILNIKSLEITLEIKAQTLCTLARSCEQKNN